MKMNSLKILLIGVLLGIIGTLVVLRLMNIPYLLTNNELPEDIEEAELDFAHDEAVFSSDSADLEQF